MSRAYLSVSNVKRRFSTGNTEELTFRPGVNLLVGRPNTGKTKWLQTLDFLLGDTGDNPFEGAEETGLAEKYDAAAARLSINGEEVLVERRWREPRAKSMVFIDGESLGIEPGNARDLGERLRSIGLEPFHTRKGRGWKGLRPLPPAAGEGPIE